MTGRPARAGSSRTSTDAKKESMSTCNTVQTSALSHAAAPASSCRAAPAPGTARRSATEPQTPEALGIAHPGPAPVLLGAIAHGPPGPFALVAELAPGARHRRH